MKALLTLFMMFLILMTSCKGESESQKHIEKFYADNGIPIDANLFVVNGLGCYYSNMRVLVHFEERFKNKKGYFMITCDSSYFRLEEKSTLRTIRNLYVDNSNLIQRLNYGTSSPTIVDRTKEGTERVIAINVDNVDSILSLY